MVDNSTNAESKSIEEAAIVFSRRPAQANVQVTSPENVTLFVTGQGTPIPTLTWLRDDMPINASTDDRFSIEEVIELPDLITSIFSIQMTVRSDTGQYTCVVSNEAGSEMALFDVVVNGRLKVKK